MPRCRWNECLEGWDSKTKSKTGPNSIQQCLVYSGSPEEVIRYTNIRISISDAEQAFVV